MLDTLLAHLEAFKDRYQDTNPLALYSSDQVAVEDHYKLAINLGWSKLNKYYTKLNNTPAYYAAVKLHPQLKNYCRSAWKHKQKEWIEPSEATFQQLWRQYHDLPIAPYGSSSPYPPSVPYDSTFNDDIERHIYGDSDRSIGPRDEYCEWAQIAPVGKGDPAIADPIGYWMNRRQQYPRLSRFALDILSIPASSAECERLFSELGDLLEPRRSSLSSDTIAATQCIKNWNRNGLIPARKHTSG
jgi:hypothetical protein